MDDEVPVRYNRALFLIPFFTAPLSFFSSIYVVYLLTRRKNRQSLLEKPRDQLLLGMSLLDICSSFGLSFSTLPGPPVPGGRTFPTIGSIETCTAQGFFVHMGLGVPMYNAAICLYYLLSIRYQVQDQKLMRWMIPVVHSFIFLYVLGTAAFAVVRKLFNFAGILGCWIGRGSLQCSLLPQYCDRGQGSEEFELYVALIPLALCFSAVVFSMVRIYVAVRALETRTRRWEFPSRANMGSSSSLIGSGSSSRRFSLFCRANEGLPISQRTMESGLLYSTAFLVVYLPIAISANVPSSIQPSIKRCLRILSVFFFPLQGLFNMLIYTSPVWLKWMREKKACQCCRRCKKSRKPRMQDMRIASDVFEEADKENVGDLELSMDFAAVKRALQPELEKYNSMIERVRSEEFGGLMASQEFSRGFSQEFRPSTRRSSLARTRPRMAPPRELSAHQRRSSWSMGDSQSSGLRAQSKSTRSAIRDAVRELEEVEALLKTQEEETETLNHMELKNGSDRQTENLSTPSPDTMNRTPNSFRRRTIEDLEELQDGSEPILQMQMDDDLSSSFRLPSLSAGDASLRSRTEDRTQQNRGKGSGGGATEGNPRSSSRRKGVRGAIRALERDIGIPLTSMNRSSASSYFNPSSVSYASSISNFSQAESTTFVEEEASTDTHGETPADIKEKGDTIEEESLSQSLGEIDHSMRRAGTGVPGENDARLEEEAEE